VTFPKLKSFFSIWSCFLHIRHHFVSFSFITKAIGLYRYTNSVGYVHYTGQAFCNWTICTENKCLWKNIPCAGIKYAHIYTKANTVFSDLTSDGQIYSAQKESFIIYWSHHCRQGCPSQQLTQPFPLSSPPFFPSVIFFNGVQGITPKKIGIKDFV